MTLARRLGVQLEPVNFPNHFLLRWCQKPRGCGLTFFLWNSVWTSWCKSLIYSATDLGRRFIHVIAASGCLYETFKKCSSNHSDWKSCRFSVSIAFNLIKDTIWVDSTLPTKVDPTIYWLLFIYVLIFYLIVFSSELDVLYFMLFSFNHSYLCLFDILASWIALIHRFMICCQWVPCMLFKLHNNFTCGCKWRNLNSTLLVQERGHLRLCLHRCLR